MTDKPFIVRPYGRPQDEGGCLYMWLVSWASSRYGRRHGISDRTSPAYKAWWDRHRAYVLGLLQQSETLLAVSPRDEDVILAFACLGPGVVHYVCAHRKHHAAGTSKDLLRDLLGERLEQPHAVSHELIELTRAGMAMPSAWHLDEYFNARHHQQKDQAP